jgi:hypothetical protein
LSVQSFVTKTWVYHSRIELYVCSFVLLAALVAVRFLLIRRKPERAASWPEPRVSVALALFTLGHVLVLAAGPYFWFRYVVGLFPVLALLQAVVIRALWPVNRLAAVAACALALFVDRHFRFDPNGPGSAPGWAEDAERMSAYLRRVPVGDYRGVRIAEIDTVWENLPEPPLHRYRAPTDGPRLVIYRRHVR